MQDPSLLPDGKAILLVYGKRTWPAGHQQLAGHWLSLLEEKAKQVQMR